ncbi:MAG: spore gernimation protein [Hamadaea sp.]|nr:spore gernimation protein [Hamadaea sp.]
MKRLAAPLVALLLAAAAVAGCSPDRSGTLGPGPSGSPAASPSASPEPEPTSSAPTPAESATSKPPTGTVTIGLWYARDGKLVFTKHTRPATVATSRLALTELATGPSVLETSVGMLTAFPAGTTYSIASITDGVATVSFDAGFYAGGRDVARLRQAQVVYTLTEFSTVKKIGFQQDGKALAAPVGRGDYADLLPFIVVTSPIVGQRTPSPITVAGTADVYEATVSIRVLDAAGKEIATTFTTATCGSGCRGTYRLGVAYRVAKQQSGVVEVYWVSAEDGSHRNVVRIPVTLVP